MNVDPIPVPEYWPVADFDAVRCLRVVAAMTPGAAIHEAVLHSPLEEVWATALDFAGAMPHWLPDVHAVLMSPGGDEAVVVGPARLRARFDIDLHPGWCLLQSRYVLGGMAVAEEEDGTRFAVLGAVRSPTAVTGAFFRPLARRLGRRSLRRFELLVQRGGDPSSRSR